MTIQVNKPFVIDQAAASGEETERKITLQATTVVRAIEFLTPPVPAEYWDIHSAE